MTFEAFISSMRAFAGAHALQADRAYLECLIDGSGDLLAEDTFARMEPLFEKYAADPEMSALLEMAATVYANAAVAAAYWAMASWAISDAQRSARGH